MQDDISMIDRIKAETADSSSGKRMDANMKKFSSEFEREVFGGKKPVKLQRDRQRQQKRVFRDTGF